MRCSQIHSFNIPVTPPDLSALFGEEKARLLRLVERWQNEPAALLTMILEIQEIWGYLPERAFEYVASALKVPLVDLFAIREFYDLLHGAPVPACSTWRGERPGSLPKSRVAPATPAASGHRPY